MPLALALLLGFPAVLAADEADFGESAFEEFLSDDEAVVIDKNEVVYARLSGSGEVRNIYIVNHFSIEEGGLIVDYGDYAKVVNLTDLGEVRLDGDEVTFRAKGGNFYYQGNPAENELPWTYAIEYWLDGEEMQAGKLGGATGELEIYLTSEQNDNVDGTFYDYYMQQITITLSTEKCTNINSEGATVANAGKDRVLVFTILPRQDADIVVTADVSGFEMTGIEIMAMPFTMNFSIPALDDMLDDFTLLADAIYELGDGVGTLDDGLLEMLSGLAQLLTGSTDYMLGLEELAENSDLLIDASNSIMDALSEIDSALSGADTSFDLSDFAEAPVFLSLLANALNQLSGGMTQLRDRYSTAYAALEASIAGIPGQQIDDDLLAGLFDKATDEERELLGRMSEGYNAAIDAKAAFSMAREVLGAVEDSLNSMIGSVDPIIEILDGFTEQLDDLLSGDDMFEEMELLAEGMSELYDSYGMFHDGLVAYIDGTLALADGYAMIDEGLLELYIGVEEMSEGVSELSEGVEMLVDETADIPDRVQGAIDNMMDEYDEIDEFEPVSFASPNNNDIGFVQFVLKTESIEKPAEKNTAPIEAEAVTFLDRLLALFKRG